MDLAGNSLKSKCRILRLAKSASIISQRFQIIQLVLRQLLSYSLVRNYLSRGVVPPKGAVRTEEFVNYFRGGYTPPKEGAFAIHTELAPSPFAHESGYQLLRIGIKGREVPALICFGIHAASFATAAL